MLRRDNSSADPSVTSEEGSFQKISVVIAAYNEAPIIADTIKHITDLLSSQDRFDWEVVIVDDGSDDNTLAEIKKISGEDVRVKAVAHKYNYGQGRALRTGFKRVTGGVIVTMDADLSYDENHIMRLVESLEKRGADICCASPYTAGGIVQNVPLHRVFLSKWANRFLSFMFRQKVTVMTCVVRAYRTEILQNLECHSDGMEYNLEVLEAARMCKAKIIEIPGYLIWKTHKTNKNNVKRLSKMNTLSTMKKFFVMGALFRPSVMIIYPALLLLFMSVIGILRTIQIFWLNYVEQSYQFRVAYIATWSDTSSTLAIYLAMGIFGFLGFAISILTRYMEDVHEQNYRLHMETRMIIRSAQNKDN